MPTGTAPDRPRYDPSVQRSPKNVFDRAPVVIPELFVDPTPPWYRRPWSIALAGLALVGLVVLAVLLYLNGVRGTALLLGRGAIAVLRGFARIVT